MTPLLVVLLAIWVVRFAVGAANLASIRAPRAPDSGFPQPGLPLVSVCIPARDEEANLEKNLPAFLGQDYPNLEVIVVDDRSEDGTADVLQRHAQNPRLKIVRGETLPKDWIGKAYALEQAQRVARGEWLCFSDADSLPQPHAISRCMREALSEGADLIALVFSGRMETWAERLLLPYYLFTFVFLMPYFLLNHDRGRRLGFTLGSFAMVRRTAYDAAGGHRAVRSILHEDISLGRNISMAGFRVRVFDGSDLISFRQAVGFRGVWGNLARTHSTLIPGRALLPLTVLAIRVYLNVGPFAALAALPWIFTTARAGLLAAILALMYSGIALFCLRERNAIFFLLWPFAALMACANYACAIWMRWTGTLAWKGRKVDLAA